MGEMQVIIQIQAQIDAFLVGDGDVTEDGLLASRLEAGGWGEPHRRVVEQATKLLRMRQRMLRVGFFFFFCNVCLHL